ncbi:hypothetical protein GCM10011611_24590 [Aliidongia dinghuensis]|uniref:CdiA toxin EC869-like domain-containing protein n=1 Tax=Aliidongia dinghuensis TaxID=1867774 RepID=A0A8J3E3P4_9PROT|nr:hypothetical protein [Aliidongia dinghuensis]GGF17820.1 hypothetical protein GCM10011611_24590 [Aliidongia dinghuensis]
MHAVALRRFRLAKGFGLDCTADGLTLAGVPLLRRASRGFVPRDDLEIRWLLERAYGATVDADRVAKGLDAVAQALNEAQPARAMIQALLLDLPELDWTGAARLARAEDKLAKFDPDEPRDERGRWVANGNDAVPARSLHGLPPKLSRSPLRLVSAGPEEDGLHGDPSHAEALQAALDAEPWVSLPPGERIDELGDLLEWVANAKPEEAPVIRGEIKRLYYDYGDTAGGNALNLALSDALEATSLADRADILKRFEPYTREDPAQAALLGQLLVSAALHSAPQPPTLRIPDPVPPSEDWRLPPVARGDVIHETYGANLPHGFPVIDKQLVRRITSIKSIDLNAATYQSELRLLRQLNRYVDRLANFKGTKWGQKEVWPDSTVRRELALVIPSGSGSAAQRAAIAAAKSRAQKLGIDFTEIEH